MAAPARTLVFDRSFDAATPDVGRREDIRPGDVVTFIPDRITFVSRRVAEVRGQIVVTEPFPGEKAHTFALACITSITR